ncbi:MAG: hypothetical protein ACKOUT_09975 [Novosphingobium sp.]
MSEGPADLAQVRKQRNSARSRLSGRFSTLKGDYAEKGIGKRLGEQVTGKVKGAAHDLGGVARESKGVIAGAAGLIGLWFARRPLLTFGGRWWNKFKARIDKDF